METVKDLEFRVCLFLLFLQEATHDVRYQTEYGGGSIHVHKSKIIQLLVIVDRVWNQKLLNLDNWVKAGHTVQR